MNDQGIGSWARRRARMVPAKAALVEQGRITTYRELDDRAAAVAAGLRTRGVRRGDRVAYLGHNSADLVVAMLATAKLAAIFVPLNTRLAAPELAGVLTDADPRLLLWKADFADVVRAEELTALRIEDLPLDLDDGASLDALGEPDAEPLDEPVSLDDLFMIQYTSGTSGAPKGVQLTHANVTWNVYNLLADVDVCTDEIALVTAPLFHTAALNQVLFPTLLKGGTALIEARFDPQRVVDLIEQERVTLLFGVTSMYLAIAGVPGFATADLSSIRSALTGGAPVPQKVLELWLDRGVQLVQGYGLTESSPGATMLRGDAPPQKLGTAGPAVFFTDVRVVSPTGEPVGVDEPGEVQISGPNVTPGYWRNPQATRDTFVDSGWLRTGDLAVVDSDGFVRIVDRLKDMFISGGENVYPAEVEQAIYTHPDVAECAVIGVPDEQWGEVGRAVVVLRAGAAVDEPAMLAHLDGRLARYKIPKSVVIVDGLPHNGSGKLLKSVLRAELGNDHRSEDR